MTSHKDMATRSKPRLNGLLTPPSIFFDLARALVDLGEVGENLHDKQVYARTNNKLYTNPAGNRATADAVAAGLSLVTTESALLDSYYGRVVVGRTFTAAFPVLFDSATQSIALSAPGTSSERRTGISTSALARRADAEWNMAIRGTVTGPLAMPGRQGIFLVAKPRPAIGL
jgi:hypothetical protein